MTTFNQISVNISFSNFEKYRIFYTIIKKYAAHILMFSSFFKRLCLNLFAIKTCQTITTCRIISLKRSLDGVRTVAWKINRVYSRRFLMGEYEAGGMVVF